MTRPYPLSKDVAPNRDAPSEPLWEGLLNDGDLLYIPRGWWHVATPLDEPTLHLTVGVSNPTGADLLAWYVERLRAHEAVRKDLPLFGTADEQEQYFESLRGLLLNEWRPGLIAEYMQEGDAISQPRPRMSLPWAASSDPVPPADVPFNVVWTGPRAATLTRNEASGEITITANGRRWRFAGNAAPLLEVLVSGRPCSMADLLRAADGSIDENTIRTFVGELVGAGLVVAIGA